jgi:hypothetical protein
LHDIFVNHWLDLILPLIINPNEKINRVQECRV